MKLTTSAVCLALLAGSLLSLPAAGTCPYQTDNVIYSTEVLVATEHPLSCSSSEAASIQSGIDSVLATFGQTGILSSSIEDFGAGSVSCGRRALQDQGERNLQYYVHFGYVFSATVGVSGTCNFCSGDSSDDRRRGLRGSNKGLQNAGKSSDDEQEMSGPITTRKLDEEIADSSGKQRRRVTCGGCFVLDFATDSSGTTITGTPYLNTNEYYDSHGVTIEASGGYTPNDSARIFNTDQPGSDPDLGSPNQNCQPPGPGVGSAGGPTLNGATNLGSNCEAQGNVLIIQNPSTSNADDNENGGNIEFIFRYPVTLNSIKLMNLNANSNDYIKIWNTAGDELTHYPEGFGPNSVELITFDRKQVTRVRVYFQGSGAISYINYCHECGTEVPTLNAAVDDFYGSSSSSVDSFESLIPTMESQLDSSISSAIANVGCLTANNNVYSVHSHIHVSTPEYVCPAPAPSGPIVCALPSETSQYSVITLGDAKISGSNVPKGVAIGGAFIDGTPNQYGSINGFACYGSIDPDPIKFNFNGGKQGGCDISSRVDFSRYEDLARNVVASSNGQYQVFVRKNGGRFGGDDFLGPDAQGNVNGNAIVFFDTTQDVEIEKTVRGRDFALSIVAPFSKVKLLSGTRVDGFIVAKSLDGDGDSDGGDVYGKSFNGNLSC